MSDIIEVTDANFEEAVTNSSGPIVVDFSASWCGPCKMLEPILEELATEYKGKVAVAHVDVDHAQTSAAKFRVMSVPTMIFMKDGQPVDQHVGLLPKDQLKQKFDAILA